MNDRLHLKPRVGCLNIKRFTGSHVFLYVADSLFAWYLVSEMGFYFLVLVCVCVFVRVRSVAYFCSFSPGRNSFQGTYMLWVLCAISAEPATAQPCMRRIQNTVTFSFWAKDIRSSCSEGPQVHCFRLFLAVILGVVSQEHWRVCN